MAIPYIETPADLEASVASYERQMADLDAFGAEVAEDVVKLLPRQNLWVALPDADKGFLVAPSKWAGHKDLDLSLYRKHLREPEGSPERLNGTEADRRIAKLGGADIEVAGSNHPAAQAVRQLCGRFGKTVKANARVRVFESGQPTQLNSSVSVNLPTQKEASFAPDFAQSLTIAEAKRGLAIQFGCRPSDIQITIKA
ncbi:MAG: hypothetical protein ACK4SZ_02810 [Allosphingosinicella sp.]|uniref:hypothetical protein n=1 Tax=Allosphingosinicella sp. TaxID=2823234 RepID=UPI003961E897